MQAVPPWTLRTALSGFGALLADLGVRVQGLGCVPWPGLCREPMHMALPRLTWTFPTRQRAMRPAGP